MEAGPSHVPANEPVTATMAAGTRSHDLKQTIDNTEREHDDDDPPVHCSQGPGHRQPCEPEEQHPDCSDQYQELLGKDLGEKQVSCESSNDAYTPMVCPGPNPGSEECQVRVGDEIGPPASTHKEHKASDDNHGRTQSSGDLRVAGMERMVVPGPRRLTYGSTDARLRGMVPAGTMLKGPQVAKGPEGPKKPVQEQGKRGNLPGTRRLTASSLRTQRRGMSAWLGLGRAGKPESTGEAAPEEPRRPFRLSGDEGAEKKDKEQERDPAAGPERESAGRRDH